METALKYLREYLSVGDMVYTILRHVTKAGTGRSISVVIPTMSPEGALGIYDITHLVAKAGRYTVDERHGGVKISGCGMDMGFSLVYELGRTMWPDGFDCIGNGCVSNDHSNGESNHHHVDGGYALRQSWR